MRTQYCGGILNLMSTKWCPRLDGPPCTHSSFMMLIVLEYHQHIKHYSAAKKINLSLLYTLYVGLQIFFLQCTIFSYVTLELSNALSWASSLDGLADSDPAGVEDTELNPKSGLRSLLFPPPPPPGGPGAAAEGRFSDIILALRSSVMAAVAARIDG